MNHRKFVRNNCKDMLQEESQNIKKMCKKSKVKPTVHNQVCMVMKMFSSFR